MNSLNDALATSFDVDIRQIAAATTGLTIDKVESLTASIGVVKSTLCSACSVTPVWPQD